MTRYAVTQDKALTTLYTDADDVLDAVNWARRVLIDHAQYGEAARMGLGGSESDSERLEPW